MGLILVAASWLGWHEWSREGEEKAQRNTVLLSEASAALEAVRDVLETTAAAQALVDEEGEVDPVRFESYAAAFLRQPAINSVAYQRRVDAVDRASFEAGTGIEITEANEDDRSVRAGVRARYFPITLVASVDGQAATGFDVASEPLRLEAIRRAQSDAQPVATEPLRFPPDDDLGFLVFTPLFVSAPSSGESPDELAGLVSVVYLAEELEEFLLSQLPRGTGLRITHRDGMLVDSGNVGAQASETVVVVAGRQWTVAVDHPVDLSLGDAVAALGAGLALAAAVATAGTYLIRQNRRLDVERTRTLRLQAATADLATSPMPATVRSSAVQHVSAMLDGAWTTYLHLDSRGQMHLLAASAEEDRRDQLPPKVVTTALKSGRVSRADTDGDGADDVLVFPTGGNPGGSDALAVLPSDPAPNERDVQLCASLAVVVGAAMRRAETHELERRMAESLQRQALPSSIPRVPGWSMGATYRPASGDAGVGGDWYDISTPREGRLVIVVGDIVGHGVNAAGSMGQVRMAVRSLAEVLPPHHILERLDRIASDIPGAEHASIICMEANLETNELTHCTAGLLPPIIVRDGAADFLWNGRGPIVGVRPSHPRDPAVEKLGRGDRLIIYTDGLIEKRNREIDDGLAELASAAVLTSHLDSGQACEAILAELTHTRPAQDDIALVVISLDR